jgi:hypothetical protein
MEPKKTDNDVIVELIRLVDCHKYNLFKYYDVFGGGVSNILFSMIAILSSAVVVMTVGVFWGTINIVEAIVITLTLIATFMAFFSFMAQIGERNMVDVRFERALKLKQFTEEEKPLLKALIKLRSRNPITDLELIYSTYPEMFTRKKLLERIYEEKMFG